ncbi:hypothetical protein Tco_1070386 [Tanacetum coccineum]|uniref:Uncharacterized protein n=1 Tax=Tanacetum coccineum TaxID=301880 RepID=A0ABQ5HMD3_9ASTR
MNLTLNQKTPMKLKRSLRCLLMMRRLQKMQWIGSRSRKARLAEEEAINAAFIQDFADSKAELKLEILALMAQAKKSERGERKQRAAAIRNRPPTRKLSSGCQLMTFLETLKRFDESFTVVGSNEDERKIKEMNEEAKDPGQKRLKKRVAKETAKRRTHHGTIDSEIMERKSFISKLDKVSSPEGDYLVVYRQYSEVTLEGFELILWGDLKIMMESSTEENDHSDFWNNQQNWEIVRWRLYEACGVYILELEDGTIIHMLVERRYPLSKDLLQRMLDLGLEVEEESTAALHLDGDDMLLDENEKDFIELNKNVEGLARQKKEGVDKRLSEMIDISFALTIDVQVILSRQRWMIGNSKEWRVQKGGKVIQKLLLMTIVSPSLDVARYGLNSFPLNVICFVLRALRDSYATRVNLSRDWHEICLFLFSDWMLGSYPFDLSSPSQSTLEGVLFMLLGAGFVEAYRNQLSLTLFAS